MFCGVTLLIRSMERVASSISFRLDTLNRTFRNIIWTGYRSSSVK
jgi:hypothetical protein